MKYRALHHLFRIIILYDQKMLCSIPDFLPEKSFYFHSGFSNQVDSNKNCLEECLPKDHFDNSPSNFNMFSDVSANLNEPAYMNQRNAGSLYLLVWASFFNLLTL